MGHQLIESRWRAATKGAAQRVVADRRPPALGAGWAAASLDRSLRRALLFGNAAWHLLMLPVVVGTISDRSALMLLLFGHAVVAAMFVAARADHFPPGVALTGSWLMFLAGWTVDTSDGALLFAACWTANLAAGTPAFTMRGRAALALPLAAATLLPPTMILVRPGHESFLPPSVLVTTTAIVVATRFGVSHLWDIADRADAESALAAVQTRALAAAHVASAEASEDARVLHDTVINTLAAIASGGAGLRHVDAVRRRCAQDVKTIEALESGRPPVPLGSLESGTHVSGTDLRIHRSGLTGSALHRELNDLPPAVHRALLGAVDELLQNAAKHAGVDRVDLGVTSDDREFTVRVADAGRGLEGQLPHDRGFARSVRERAESVGLTVNVVSAPGQGTIVLLTHRRDAELHTGGGNGPAVRVDRAEAGTFRDVIDGLRVRAAWLFAWGVTAVGLVLAISNHHGAWNEEYLMVGALVLALALARWDDRRNASHLSPLAAGGLALGAVAAFLLAGAAVDFGRESPVAWQAIGCTGPLVLLLALARSPRPFRAACALLALVVATTAAWVARDSGEAALNVLLAGVIALGLVSGWAAFHRTIGSIAAQILRDHRAAETARADTAKVEAAAATRQRWRSAGLHDVLTLLRGIATGQLDPRDSSVRDQCDGEETYLRQLIQLDPALTRMGPWYAHALRHARGMGVQLTLRSGGTDPASEEIASALGHELLRAVESLEPGEPLTVALFPSAEGLRMTLVAPHPRLVRGMAEDPPPPSLQPSFRSLGNQDMIEILTPGTVAVPHHMTRPPARRQRGTART